MSTNPAKILLVDDHAILREALSSILRSRPEFTVVGAFSSVRAAVEPGITPPDVIVLDITMPEIGGLAGLPMLRKRFPRARVLMLSMHSPEIFGLRALRAGAKGYLTKETKPSELIAAIRTVAAGGRVIPEELVEVLATSLDPSVQNALHEKLSDREFEVLQRLAVGDKVTDIARELQLNVRTISNDRTQVMEKLHLQSQADLVRYAMDHQLLIK